MNLRNLWLALALCLPIAALAINAYQHHQQLQKGESIVLPIKGFDPRDLLSGHYLIYTVDYGVENLCQEVEENQTLEVCLKPTSALRAAAMQCDLYIQGTCQRNRFKTGIERFYIPEAQAKPLDQALRNEKGALQVNVDTQGKAQIETLLIEGQLWQEWLKEQKP